MPTKPTTQKRGRGRPAFMPTAQQRRQVSVAAGGGMRHLDIATVLGISRDTLEKYFQAELTQGALARRMEVLQGLHAAAKKGSSSAAKAYLAVEPQLAVPPLLPDGEGDAPPAAASQPAAPASSPKAEPLGKKAQQQADALTAQVGTEWDQLLPRPPLQ